MKRNQVSHLSLAKQALLRVLATSQMTLKDNSVSGIYLVTEPLWLAIRVLWEDVTQDHHYLVDHQLFLSSVEEVLVQ